MSLDRQGITLDKVDLVAKIPLFSEIGAANREILASSSEVLKLDSGQVLFHQGDVGEQAYIIVKGEAEVTIEGPDGHIAVATIGPHQFIGEIAILIDVSRTATVTALTDLTVLMVSMEMFYRLVTEFPSIGIEVMRELARRLYKTTSQLRQVSTDYETIEFSG